MDRRIRAGAVAAFLALMLVYVGANAYRRYLSARGEVGWYSASGRGGLKIVEVVRGGAAEGLLEEGDELLAINGAGDLGQSDAVNAQMRRVAPGEPYTMVVRRAGQVREVTLRVRRTPLPTLLNAYVLKILTPLSFLLTGVVVFLLKPFDKEAVLLALLLGVFPALPNGFFGSYAGYPAALAWALWAARVAAYALFVSVFTHFFLVFPESKGFASPLLRRFPRLERRLYLSLIFFVPFGVLLVMAQGDMLNTLGATSRRAVDLVFMVGAVTGLGAIVGGLVSLVLNYRLSDEASRRKMRVVVLASLVAFVPLFIMLVFETFDLISLVRPLSRWLDYSLYFLLPLVPLSFAYAIVRHKVIPVSLIIRRGVRYLFVARGSVALEIATVGVVMFFLMDWLFSRTTATGRTVGVVSGVVAILVWVAARALHVRVVAPAIDRRFFRRSYNAQQILSELGQTLRTLPRVEETCALVSARVQEALQTENVTVFLRDEASGDFRAECSTRFLKAERQVIVGRQELRLARDSFVVARLAESSEQPLDVDFEDPQGWARLLDSGAGAAGESRRREGETLRAAGSALLLPVATKDDLVGVISLGARLGDLPFSGEDTQMLSAVAVQVAFALENARLLERRAEEVRLRRELEMATEVQQRIFPERAPETDSLDLAGSCTPARGVGGDYYDFLLLEGGRVGLAVADVAGKGMSAALLMSIVQASLRSQAQAAGGDLCGLVASMNLLLHRSSGSSSYATFFYAQFDAATRRLTYVNAGHNPPLLVRAGRASDSRDGAGGGAGAGVELLQTGGPVIGLFEHFTFEQATVQLKEGDVLVAFTDGVSEALNPEGEEFGEPRLFALATAHAGLSAGEIHARVSDEVRAFCRDAPQHDDLTLVIAKVK